MHMKQIQSGRLTERVTAVMAALVLLICAWCPAMAYADAIDDDLEAQWSKRDIPAVTGAPCFTTANRFELALNLGIVPTDDYYNYFPLFLDVHYRFTEMWGLGFRASLLMMHTDTTLSDFIDRHQSSISTDMLGDEQKGDLALVATFHPVYGKTTVETANLGRFDWGVFAGIGVVFSESANARRTKRDVSGHAEGILGTDAHIFFLDWLALRLEASLRFYHAPTQWVVPCTLSVGVSFLLPEL